ncbi:hypothetical protein AA0113_g856 [Alternaria arborescens]|jgi:hypothetical protein|uniref:Uncharacterized protein n=3 Tax=Alternaria sect. Alternaria TaxID=2499237 RepID=A0A4Q4N896_ALTAL|nr:hypothetical protein AA0111_g5831 [Alternaria arborescens]KAH8626522.1 hypothetical protein IG631_18540 [Alternaria alternata]RYN25831.1 hypothetical protein AA0115_g7418 [Alternaria tenuissima]RYN39093.1 hypothetical protein AA0112_g3759 [Alternaria arborescens]RYN47243.1 hypothetical protein AA0118_g12239 [Alternaria tenuissima]RYN54527.1 hypothetical protein AA0114_g3969 [Alternaria tenuissima]
MGYEHTRSPVAKLQSRPTSGVSYGLSLRDSRMVIGMKEGDATGCREGVQSTGVVEGASEGN